MQVRLVNLVSESVADGSFSYRSFSYCSFDDQEDKLFDRALRLKV